MRNKKNVKKGRAAPKTAPKQPKPTVTQARKTPFTNTGGTIGAMAGSMIGHPVIGAGIGRFLGAGIGSIFGSGDYSMNGPRPKYNVLMNGQIPKFSTEKATNIVCHREYLGDINGTSAFTNAAYPLNPGISTTFPWLSTIAANYQEYKFHGILFEFRSLITDFIPSGAPGVVIMATDYNAAAAPFVSKQQMENSEYAVAVKPTLNLIHGIECATNQTVLHEQYVRTSAVPIGGNVDMYDLGTFQLATQQNPIQDLGELWVTYCVEFFKPILPVDIGGITSSGKIQRFTSSNASPFGLIQTTSTGSIAVTSNGTNIAWTSSPGQKWLVTVYWVAPIAVAFVPPSFTTTGLTFNNSYNNFADNNATAPNSGITTIHAMVQYVMTCTLTNPGIVAITQTAPGTVPAGSVDIIVTELDNAIV